jgi:hypothetical protein
MPNMACAHEKHSAHNDALTTLTCITWTKWRKTHLNMQPALNTTWSKQDLAEALWAEQCGCNPEGSTTTTWLKSDRAYGSQLAQLQWWEDSTILSLSCSSRTSAVGRSRNVGVPMVINTTHTSWRRTPHPQLCHSRHSCFHALLI